MNDEIQFSPEELIEKRKEILRFLMGYKFALEQMKTKIDLLKNEFRHVHDYSPIEHVTSRVKTPESIMRKMKRRNIPLTMDAIKENIRDIAGIRITCSFETDIYVLHRMLEEHGDVEIIEEKDYINNPKGNGYRSLHLIVEVPVYMSDRKEKVLVEVQIRTIAMDFSASFEHDIRYKRMENENREDLLLRLKLVAQKIHTLDKEMMQIFHDSRFIDEN